MSFYGGIKSYDIHVYWNNNNKEEEKFAFELQEKILNEFAIEIKNGDIIQKFWNKPIGPHPINMFEIDFEKIELFARVVSFFQLNHGKLSVLIHPNSEEGELKDHTDHALWLGHKVRLDISYLK